jgi:Tol biopolymer transport system component
MIRVGAADVSPAGVCAFSCRAYDFKERKWDEQIYAIPDLGKALGAEGSPPVRLTGTQHKTNSGPTFTPDGKSLVFSSNRDGGAPQV